MHAAPAPLPHAFPRSLPRPPAASSAVTPADPARPDVAPAPAVAPPLAGLAHGPLPGLVAVDVTGPDAEPFLQGQLSNDLVALGSDAVQLSGWCSPKGRLLASPIVHRLADGFRLVLPADLVPGFAQRLRMFVLRAAVNVAPRDDLVAFALFVPDDGPDGAPEAGPDAASGDVAGAWLTAAGVGPGNLATGEPLRAALGADGASALVWHPLRAGRDAGDGAADGTAVRAPLRRLLAFAPPAAAAAALDRVAAAAPGATTLSAREADGAWRLGDVRAGLPAVRVATRDAFVPQMVNFGEAGGLSFKKGCYPGQEIVARMQYLGKLKRHARAFRAVGVPDGAPAPLPGDALDVRAADGTVAAGAAEVVDAVALGASIELLVVVRTDAGDVELDVGGARGTAFELPYVPPGAGETRGRVAAGDVGGSAS